MRTVGRLTLPLACLGFLFALPAPLRADPPEQLRSRVMVLVDTSGSMLYHFGNDNSAGGDGSTCYYDGLTHSDTPTNSSCPSDHGYYFLYPGNSISGGYDGYNSRMYAAKQALTNAVNAYAGNIDFGLEVYDFDWSQSNGQLRSNCRTFGGNGSSTCQYSISNSNVNFIGKGCSGNGGRVLVQPDNGSGAKILPYIDGVEDYNASTGDPLIPRNPEIRANGGTPLAAAIKYARTNWYQAVSPSDDKKDCRPYVLVAETDGAEACNGDPPSEALALYNANPNNHPLTYVVGLSIGSSDMTSLNNTAASGGTGAARFASSQHDIEAAYADILVRSIKVELCNGQDDNCNNVVDEGYDLGATCAVGVGACMRTGVKKCDAANDTQTACCVDDVQGTCTPLQPAAPQAETCNGIDDDCDGIVDNPPVCDHSQCTSEVCNGLDDDCDGIVDNHLTDAGFACGSSIGICTPGVTRCVAGELKCQGGTQPRAETCNGLDDDCDGVVDGMTRPCYDGASGTQDVGLCHGGAQQCAAPAGSNTERWGSCVGEVLPKAEVCNGLDDDCDGTVDNVMAGGHMAGAACCPSGKCGVGLCTAGVYQCSGGALSCIGGQAPVAEICNGLDDDCDGTVDNVPGVGSACQPPNGCGGTMVCDTATTALVCQPSGAGGMEVCNGADDDCDDIVDNPDKVAANDPRVGQPCGVDATMLTGACKAGKTVCAEGGIACEGAVGPSMEVCNCIDDDCDGKVDDDATCPGGSACVDCQCLSPCEGGEFPCPGGYECVNGYCRPDAACDPPCQDGFECRGGLCIDKCNSVNCPEGYLCQDGNCVDDTCRTHPDRCKACDGGSGERCDITLATPACVPDLCCGKSCGADQFCDPRTGECKGTCEGVECPDGQLCRDGQCAADRCADKSCPIGYVCNPDDGACVKNPCDTTTCLGGLVCCAASCQQDDPCQSARCPEGRRCQLNPLDCSYSCMAPPKQPVAEQDRVLGAGGGGFSFGCSVGAPGAAHEPVSSRGVLALLGLAWMGMLVRRRRLQ